MLTPDAVNSTLGVRLSVPSPAQPPYIDEEAAGQANGGSQYAKGPASAR